MIDIPQELLNRVPKFSSLELTDIAELTIWMRLYNAGEGISWYFYEKYQMECEILFRGFAIGEDTMQHGTLSRSDLEDIIDAQARQQYATQPLYLCC